MTGDSPAANTAIQPIRGERYFRLDSGYLYFLELVDTQVIIIATQTLYFNTAQ